VFLEQVVIAAAREPSGAVSVRLARPARRWPTVDASLVFFQCTVAPDGRVEVKKDEIPKPDTPLTRAKADLDRSLGKAIRAALGYRKLAGKAQFAAQVKATREGGEYFVEVTPIPHVHGDDRTYIFSSRFRLVKVWHGR
jgi:hypothetical protein